MLAGFDGSIPSEHALVYAAGVARRVGASLLVVHVEPCPVPTYPGGLIVVPGDDGSLEGRARGILEPSGVPWTFLHTLGPVDVRLLSIARARHVDSIVIGRSAQWIHRVTGSVASRLARHCELPLTVVP